MVLIASNITKIVDVIKTGCTSIEMLHTNLMLVKPHYIEQTPPQCMHVKELGKVLSIYTSMQQANTKNVDMHDKNQPTSPKPFKHPPIGIKCQNGRNLEGQYSMCSSLIRAFLKCEWNQKHIPIYE